MSYRINNKNQITWKKWSAQNRDELLSSGLPEFVWQNEEHWWDFLLHGYLDHHYDLSNFDLNQLSNQEKIYLLQFLERELTKSEKESAVVFKILKSNIDSI